MMEMRWYVPVSGEKVLQYRQQYDATIRAGMWAEERVTNMQWSEWKDVPVIAERDPSYP